MLLEKLVIGKVIEKLLEKVDLKTSGAKTSAAGAAVAGGAVVAASSGSLDTLEGQVATALAAIVSLVLFLIKNRS